MDTQVLKKTTPEREILGGIFRRYRIRQGLNQKAIAEALGVKQSTYSRMESGQHETTVTQLRIIARQLGAAPSRILLELDRTYELDKRPHVF